MEYLFCDYTPICFYSIISRMDAKYKIIAFVGLPMTGKSTARELMQEILDEHGIPQDYVHFGSTEEVERRNEAGEWDPDQSEWTMEQKERFLREQWRAELGMGAMAIKQLAKIGSDINDGKLVLIDNLYSDEERTVLMREFGEDALLLVATVADWKTRVERGKKRAYRPLTESELAERDQAEIYNLHKAPPVVLARVTIANNSDDLGILKSELEARVLPYISSVSEPS